MSDKMVNRAHTTRRCQNCRLDRLDPWTWPILAGCTLSGRLDLEKILTCRLYTPQSRLRIDRIRAGKLQTELDCVKVTRCKPNAPLQSPVDVKKNPVEHFAHAFPSSPVVNPALQAHWPLAPHAPLRQLHVAGALATTGLTHLPVPVMPSSQVVQLSGQGLHSGPKKPVAHDSHDDPVNPGAHWQVPEAEQTPEPAHGGEHADDWISTSESDPELPSGS